MIVSTSPVLCTRTPFRRFSYLAATFAIAAGSFQPTNARAQAPIIPPLPFQTQTLASGLRITVSAVEPNVFHIVASPAGEPDAPVSPFAVETQPWGRAKVQRDGDGNGSIETPVAALNLGADGVFTIQAGKDAPLVREGKIAVTPSGVSLTFAHDADQRLYGAGNADMNRAGDLTHPSGAQVVKNGATRIPFLWSTGGYGVLIANNLNGVSWDDADNRLTWKVPAPYLDAYLIVAPGGPYEIFDAYSRLTGRAPIPPKWTFGYMQSRWGYVDAADVQDKWRQFRDRKIPVDAFIYDYDWFQKDWQFNPTTFPVGSLDTMKQMGLHFVGIRKPRVTGDNFEFANKRGWILSAPLGKDLRFDVPEARYWWWHNDAPLITAGVSGWWNDEAEQSFDEFFQMTSTEWYGQRALNSNRVWNISRAFAPGMQRFGAAVWSGDITGSWTTLQNQPGTLLNFSMAGMPYEGQDIGGFFGDPSPELFTRWIEEGVFVPVMRAHGNLNSARWPWAFGPEAEAAMKQAIELRYKLIPYTYTFAELNAKTGAPIMRPLFLEFPSDPKTFNLEDEWLVGDRILAAPILAEGGSRDVYLPAGSWYDFNTSTAIPGGQTISVKNAALSTIPFYIRAGTILPLGPVLQYTGQAPEDPLEIRVYPGADGSFSLYEDAGEDYEYLNGASSEIPFTWNDKSKTLTVGRRKGSFPRMLETRHLDIVLPDGSKKAVDYTGDRVQVSF